MSFKDSLSELKYEIPFFVGRTRVVSSVLGGAKRIVLKILKHQPKINLLSCKHLLMETLIMDYCCYLNKVK